MSCSGTWTYTGFTFHNYMDHTLGRGVSTAAGDGLQLQHDLHAALDPRLPAGPARPHRPGRASSASASRPASRTWPMTPASCPTRRTSEHASAATARSTRTGRSTRSSSRSGRAATSARRCSWPTPMRRSATAARCGRHGSWSRPRLPDGSVVERNKPQLRAADQPQPRRSFDYMVQSLRAVVTCPTARPTAAFAGFGIPVAGKSGTAETGDARSRTPGSRPSRRPTTRDRGRHGPRPRAAGNRRLGRRAAGPAGRCATLLRRAGEGRSSRHSSL